MIRRDGELARHAAVEIDPFFSATVYATEEAILNALLAAETMTGADGLRVPALPHDRLVEIMRRYRGQD